VLDNTALGQPCPEHGEEYIRHFCDDNPAVDAWGYTREIYDADYISALKGYDKEWV
jgi:hypothetical protein